MRRNFTRNQKEEIVLRATDAQGVVRCEHCNLAMKSGSWEIDHIIPEALRPEADKKAKLTIAEGQLLGRDCCHRGEDGKTRQDVKAIAKGKRQYNAANGIKRPKQALKSAGFPKCERAHADRKALPPRRIFAEDIPSRPFPTYRKPPLFVEEQDRGSD